MSQEGQEFAFQSKALPILVKGSNRETLDLVFDLSDEDSYQAIIGFYQKAMTNDFLWEHGLKNPTTPRTH